MRRMLAVSVLATLGAASAADACGPLPDVEATLDYAAPDAERAEAFFARLQESAGKAIHLRLTIIPGQQGDDPGYGLTARGVESADGIVCGRGGTLGIVENSRTEHELTLGHPENQHVLLSIEIGERRSFPFHSIVCSTEDYTTVERTPLEVTGDFVVTAATIPTATQIVLYPCRP